MTTHYEKLPFEKDKFVKISKKKLRCLLDWAYNFGKNDYLEYRYRRKRDEKINKSFEEKK